MTAADMLEGFIGGGDKKKWTLNTVWYLFLSVLEDAGKSCTRGYVKRLVKDLCELKDTTREALGIFAGVRAELYFDGNWTSVSFDRIHELASKGTDIIFIEKEGVPEMLTEYADKYGIAMVNTRGHITEYGKDLMHAAKQSGAHVVILTDYDNTGVKIASEYPVNMPWIGINDEALNDFGLSVDTKHLAYSSDTTANKEYIKYLVKYGQHPDKGANDNVGKKDTRFKNVDVNFLDSQRVEIDSVLAQLEEMPPSDTGKVGAERFFEWITGKLVELFPTRDYNRAISMPGNEMLYPKRLQEFNTFVNLYVENVVKDEETKIENDLQNTKGIIDIDVKNEEIQKQLDEIVSNDDGVKLIVSKVDEILKELIKKKEE